MAYIGIKETEALGMAADQIRNVLEGCTADEDSQIVIDLNFMIEHLDNLRRKGLSNWRVMRALEKGTSVPQANELSPHVSGSVFCTCLSRKTTTKDGKFVCRFCGKEIKN